MKTKKHVLVSVLVIAGSLLAACAPKEVLVTEEVTRVVVEKVVETAVVVETVVVEGTPQVVEKEVTVVVEVEKVVTAAPEPEVTIKRGGVLKVGVEADVNTLDPALFTASSDYRYLSLVYESLVTWDRESLLARPLLAKSWEVSDDELTWTFHLREDVTWHNGDPFVAGDVKYTAERIMDPELGSTKTYVFAVVESIEVIDDHTVAFHQSEPYGALANEMAREFLIVNQRFVEENEGDLARTMMGTGPFMFEEWVPDQVVRLVRNPNYWRMGADGQSLPYLDGVDWMPNADGTAQVADFGAGVIDFIGLVPDKDVERLLDDPGVVMVGPDSLWYTGLIFNTTIPPFDDVRVRQALSWAVDRDEIAEVGLFDNARPAYGAALPPWHWASSRATIWDHRDLEKARALLAEAGYPDGEGFPEVEIRAGIPYPGQVTMAEMTASYLGDLGIEAKAAPTEWGTLIKEMYGGLYPMTICGWISTGDPDELYRKNFHSEGPSNKTKYSNPELDRLIEEGRATSNMDERADLYAQVEEILLEEVPQPFLVYHNLWEAMYPYVKGYVHMANMSIQSLAEVWLDK